MINKVTIVGRIGNVETKAVGNGNVTKFSVATNEVWYVEGEKKESTEWHNCNAWSKVGEACAKYLSKGMLVYVEGKLQTRTWEKDGEKKYATDITAFTVKFLSKPEPKKSEPSFDDNENIPF